MKPAESFDVRLAARPPASLAVRESPERAPRTTRVPNDGCTTAARRSRRQRPSRDPFRVFRGTARALWFATFALGMAGAGLACGGDGSHDADAGPNGTSVDGGLADAGTLDAGSCTPDCTDLQCGDDGCGGSCGRCAAGRSCSSGRCVERCTPDCTGRQCGDDGCGGSCGRCAAGQSCSGGRCVERCTPSCAGRQCGDDGCGGSCGTCADLEMCTAGGQCQPERFVFPGGQLSELEARRPSLEFGDLVVDGDLILDEDVRSATIRAENLTIRGRIDWEEPICDDLGYDAPDVSLIARRDVRVGGAVQLAGKTGDDELSSSRCNSCTGGDGGNFTVDARNITVAGYVHTWGGSGARLRDPNGGIGCSGGDGGSVVMTARGRLEGTKWDVDMDGGRGGRGFGSYRGSNGDPGRTGRLDVDATSISLTEDDGINAMYYNATNIPLGRLDLAGDVSKRDDFDQRDLEGARYVLFTNGARDYLEDLYRIEVRETVTTQATLRFSNPHDLDLYILRGATALDAIVAEANARSNPETVNATLVPGTYHIAVSFADDAVDPRQAVPYTLELR